MLKDPLQPPKVRVLMVCLGNICRSPTAHGVLEKLIKDKALNELIQVDSAGTGNYHIGENPDSRAIVAAAQRQYSIEQQIARQVQQEDFTAFDYILAMDSSNLKDLRDRCPQAQQGKLELLLHYGDSEREAVPDPYYSGSDGFELVLDLVEEACAALLRTIVAEHQLQPQSRGETA